MPSEYITPQLAHEHSQGATSAIEGQIEELAKRTSIEDLSDHQKQAVLLAVHKDLDFVLSGSEGDTFFMVRDVWDRMATVVNSPNWHDTHTFSQEQMAAQKLYAAGVLYQLEERERAGRLPANAKRYVYDAYFSTSDQLTNFTGTYSDALELFALAQRSQIGRTMSSVMVSGLVYNGTYGDITHSLERAWKVQSDVEGHLAVLRTYNQLLIAAENEPYPTESMQNSIKKQLQSIAAGEGSAFASIVANHSLAQVAHRENEEWVFLDELPVAEQTRLLALHKQYESQREQEQQVLHAAFPQLRADAELYRIAADACAEVDQEKLGRIVTVDGGEMNLHTPETTGTLPHVCGDAELLQEAHQPDVIEVIALEAGIDIRTLSLDSQLKFFRFMAEADRSRYDRLCVMMRTRPDTNRLIFAEAFLATQFGDDHGDAILTIAETLSAEQSARIFETVNALRVRTAEYASVFSQIDPNFSAAAEKAFNERITDALTAIREVAQQGSLHEDVAPHRHRADYVHTGQFDIRIKSIDEAIEILQGLEASFAAMHNIITADDLEVTTINEDRTQFVLYRLMSQQKGNMLAYIRPEGGYRYDKSVEYGSFAGVEASINLKVNPSNPYRLLMPKDKDAVSIRFDREGRGIHDDIEIVSRDPAQQQGVVSADISSGFGNPALLSVKIGRMIAAGNRIRARRQGTNDSLHHNTNYFDQQKYGTADGFAELARGVIRHLDLLEKTRRFSKFGKTTTVTAQKAA
ncbi:MAG: hypothetical protein WAQ25_00270 [Candidatus Saccharimonas sp.]